MIQLSSLSRLAESLNGLPVYGCLPGSPAARAGVRFGDIVLSVDGQVTSNWVEYIAARQNSGSSIVVRLFRDGREFGDRDGAR
ncbi:MAG: PDZ domain-containing protein [Polyangiaceae bacterium]